MSWWCATFIRHPSQLRKGQYARDECRHPPCPEPGLLGAGARRHDAPQGRRAARPFRQAASRCASLRALYGRRGWQSKSDRYLAAHGQLRPRRARPAQRIAHRAALGSSRWQQGVDAGVQQQPTEQRIRDRATLAQNYFALRVADTTKRLLEHFGSVRALRNASPDALTAVVNPATAAKIRKHFSGEAEPTNVTLPVLK